MSKKVELSTMCFRDGDVFAKINQCRSLPEAYGFEFGLQLHNTVTRDMYDKIKGLNVPFSIHAPLFSEYFINLACDDFSQILENFQSTHQVMQSLKSTIVLFHAFFMTQKPIKNDSDNYGKVLREAIDNKYFLKDTRVMDPEFLQTTEFYDYQNTVKKNIKRLRECFPYYTICIENDFPGIGNGNQTPEHLIALDCPVWLDIGHLWASSILHKFDFYEGLDTLSKRCQVVGTHLNTNQTPLDWNLKWPDGDTHSHFSQDFDMDIRKAIHILKKNGITHYTIEIINGSEKDVAFFVKTYNSV